MSYRSVLAGALLLGGAARAQQGQCPGHDAAACHLRYIPLPDGLSRSDLRRGGSAARELLHRHTLEQLGQTPPAGPDEDLVIILTDKEGLPILPDLEAVAARTELPARTEPPITLDGDPPGNRLSFTYNSSQYPWTDEELTLLEEHFTAFQTEALQVYGAPAFANTVNVRKSPTLSYAGLYTPATNELVLKSLDQSSTICHEMIHAFRDDYVLGLASFEEGMTRAAEIEVFNRLPGHVVEWENHGYVYDIYYEALDRPAIAARSGNFSRGNPNPLLLLRYQLAGYAWGKALIENPRFFVEFNQRLYAAAAGDPTVKSDEVRLRGIAADVQAQVEGRAFQDWYDRQAILDSTPHAGYHLYQRINQSTVNLFYRSSTGNESVQVNAGIDWAVFDHGDVLLDNGSAQTNSNGWISFAPGLPPGHQGRLAVLATSNSPHGAISSLSFRPAGGESGVFGVVVGADQGTLELAALDQAAPPVQVNVSNGAFSVPSLASLRGRLRATLVADAGWSLVRDFTKDASSYYLELAGPSVTVANSPADRLTGVGLRPVLSWLRPGAAIDSFEVMLSRCGTNLTRVGTAPGAEPVLDLSEDLLPGAAYLWRVDSSAGESVAPGREFLFVTTGAPEASLDFDLWAYDAGLRGVQAAPEARPFGDGVANLLKYAFNMDASGADSRRLIPGGGTSGLPSLVRAESDQGEVLRLEFLRRKSDALNYTAMQSVTMQADSWVPLSDPTTTIDIDGEWERVVIEHPLDPETEPRIFFHVVVQLGGAAAP